MQHQRVRVGDPCEQQGRRSLARSEQVQRVLRTTSAASYSMPAKKSCCRSVKPQPCPPVRSRSASGGASGTSSLPPLRQSCARERRSRKRSGRNKCVIAVRVVPKWSAGCSALHPTFRVARHHQRQHGLYFGTCCCRYASIAFTRSAPTNTRTSGNFRFTCNWLITTDLGAVRFHDHFVDIRALSPISPAQGGDGLRVRQECAAPVPSSASLPVPPKARLPMAMVGTVGRVLFSMPRIIQRMSQRAAPARSRHGERAEAGLFGSASRTLPEPFIQGERCASKT